MIERDICDDLLCQQYQQHLDHSRTQLLNKSQRRSVDNESSNVPRRGDRTFGSQRNLIEVSDVLCQLSKQQSAPGVGIDVFDGNPPNFKCFMTLFREVVESKIEDPRGRLTRLIKYTTGEAKELIKHCIEPGNKGYENVVNLLYRRYGDQQLAAYKKEVKEWPQIKVGDAAGFRKFHNFLLKCQSIIGGNKWNPLDSPESIRMLLSKLPGKLRDRWNKGVYSIREKHSREPELKDLINYVDKETALVSDPLFYKEAVDQYLDKTDVMVDKRRRVRSYAISSEEESKNKPDKDTKEKDKCVICGACHDLDDCSIFMSQAVEDRSKVPFKNKLCCGCYGCISKDHSGRNCKQRRSCRICKEKHPTG